MGKAARNRPDGRMAEWGGEGRKCRRNGARGPGFLWARRPGIVAPTEPGFAMSKRVFIASLMIAGALGVVAAVGPIYAAAKNAGASDEPAPAFSGVWVRTGEPMFEP